MTAVVYDAGAATLPESRGKMAGAKEKALKELAETYRRSSNGRDVAAILDAAAAAFREARASVRNELLHAHPYTEGTDSEGNYMPGLAYTAADGKSWKTVARSPEDLLDLAERIEQAITPLSDARAAVGALPVSALRP